MNLYTFPLNDHLVVFRPKDKQLFILNPTARWIWESCAVGADTGQIARNMADRYALPLDAAEADLRQTLSQWGAIQLDPEQSHPVSAGESTSPSDGRSYREASPPPNQTATFERQVRFGHCDIRIRDYTGHFSELIDPLTRNLPPATPKQTPGRVDIFMEEGEYAVTHNGLETGRDAMDIAAVGLLVQAMLELGYPDTPVAAYFHGAAGALNGQGVILPGMGGSGKSTLIAGLVHAGWTYLCDDTVPVNTAGGILPVPLNICLKAGSWTPLQDLYPELDTQPVYQRIGQEVRYLTMPGTASQAHQACWIVFPQYAPDKTVQVQSVPPEQVLQRLVQAQAWISPHPGNARALLTWLESTPAIEMRYATTAQAVETLINLVRP